MACNANLKLGMDEVQIFPPIVEFRDVRAGETRKQRISVRNTGKHCKQIRFFPPQSKLFSIDVKNPGVAVAPGLEVIAKITYAVEKEEELTDRLVVTIDGTVVEIPIRVLTRRPELEVDGLLDFGSMVSSCRVEMREIFIFNRGSLEGSFQINYCGNQPFVFEPSSGRVQPRSAQSIKVELLPEKLGHFDDTVSVTLEGREKATLRVAGSIVNASLELLTFESEQPLQCVKFGTTYYGTDATQSGILFNKSPKSVCFVIVLNDEAVGQETGEGVEGGQVNPFVSMVTTFPRQGLLQPYEKAPIFFRFSPRFVKSSNPRWRYGQQGFKCTQKLPPCRDFAIFMRVVVVGSLPSRCDLQAAEMSTAKEGVGLEVALTGTALPVAVSVLPRSKLDFGQCCIGQHATLSCTLTNESPKLPATFQFQRVAHFTPKPSRGRIEPKKSIDITLTFVPSQVGNFNLVQLVDIIGQVADDLQPFILHLEIIHSVSISVAGRSDAITVKREPVFNSGITPKITNEVGLYIDSKVSQLKSGPRNARVNAHRLKALKNRENSDSTLIAFPNDRAQSIGPSDRREKYETIFNGVARHNYIDPDYAYTDDQAEAVQRHRQYYADFIDELRQNRMNKLMSKEFYQHNNEKDIGLKTALGLTPKNRQCTETDLSIKVPTPPNACFRLLSTKELRQKEKQSEKQVVDGLNAIPSTPQEKADCSKMLTPAELHQVTIGPAVVDFGDVCPKSVSQKDISIINNLDQYIHFVANVDCRELRQTCPLSQVIPPCSKAVLPMIFESNTKGRFQRMLDYIINGFYKNSIIVFANVIPLQLDLSTDLIEIEQQCGLPPDTAIRGNVTLYNRLNYAAQFTWNPVVGERGTAFSIRPASGSVEPFSDLHCEVVFHPSYIAPDEGNFVLQVLGGTNLRLKCVAKIGSSNVQLVDRRVMLGQVPIHLTTTKIAMLKNSSLNHAYFQILDANPFPGLILSPVFGVVPASGTTTIQVQLTPESVVKFDTKVNIHVRNCKNLELRVCGTVEPPSVDIDLPRFEFGGVYCGSKAVVPFVLTNKGGTKAKVEFDLTQCRDFQIDFGDKQTSDDATFQCLNPGVFLISVNGDEQVNCQLVFTPTEVASYDFIMPVLVNSSSVPTPSPTPLPPQPRPCKTNTLQHIIQPRTINVDIITPRRKIIATALRGPLQVSCKALEFTMLRSVAEYGTEMGTCETFLVINSSKRNLCWALDISCASKALEEGVFKFLRKDGTPFLTFGAGGIRGTLEPCQSEPICVMFTPGCSQDKSLCFEATVPVILDDDFCRPYCHVTLTGEVKVPVLTFDPQSIVFSPVPLDIEATADFNVIASYYTQNTTLVAGLPQVECDDGSKVSPLTVTFLDCQAPMTEIKPTVEPGSTETSFQVIPCRVQFRCCKPISFSEQVTFTDGQCNSFSFMVTATSDNCLLTCYPFMAQHRLDHKIVCEQGKSLKGRCNVSLEGSSIGEAMLLPCNYRGASSSRPDSTATSSIFDARSSGYDNSFDSVAELAYQSTPREGALNKFNGNVESADDIMQRKDPLLKTFGSAVFPEEDTEEGIFFAELLSAIQRWYTSHGWPGGMFPVTIPESFRSGICRKPNAEKTKTAKGGTWESPTLEKETKTIYDMVAHLSGKPVPAINPGNPLPSEPKERVHQIHFQHKILLAFVRSQGGCTAAIKPEYLMELQDYKCWKRLQAVRKCGTGRSSVGHEHDGGQEVEESEEAMDEHVFEVLSKRSWMDLLMQMLKTLILARITPRQFKNTPTPYKNAAIPPVDVDPLCSNIYSIGERILLVWLNYHYEQQREIVWQKCTKGQTPPSRWVVNFDFDLLDGLVLAAVLAAYVPFLIDQHFVGMYTRPATGEQCLHNAICIVNALHTIGIDYDIQAIDITDPNPISMLLLSTFLYFHLPQYIPKGSIEFVAGLHEVTTRQVKLSNPSSKPLVYRALIAGLDSRDFCLPKGDSVPIGAKSSVNVMVQFKSRYMRSSEGVLLFTGRRHGSTVGSTLVFSLKSRINNITPQETIQCETPCYQLSHINITVANPFSEDGTFRVVLVEMDGEFPAPEKCFCPEPKKTKKNSNSNNNNLSDSCFKRTLAKREAEAAQQSHLVTRMGTKHSGVSGMRSFFCHTKTVQVAACETASLEVLFLPLVVGRRQCTVILTDDTLGEFLYLIAGNATAPLPEEVPPLQCSGAARVTRASAAASGNSRASVTAGGDADAVVFWKCEAGQTLEQTLAIPIKNKAKEEALGTLAQLTMSELELRRRTITGLLTNGSVTMETLRTLKSGHEDMRNPVDNCKSDDAVYTVELDSINFTAPRTLDFPTDQRSKNCKGKLTDCEEVVSLPMTFIASEPGHYPCQVTLRRGTDLRTFHVSCVVVPHGSVTQIEFISPVNECIVQNIPIVNQSSLDWPMVACIEGTGFDGPPTITAIADCVTQYPLQFIPKFEGIVQGKLVLRNTLDQVENTFCLQGKGEKPRALDTLTLRMKVKQCVEQVLTIPNVTRRKLCFLVESDLNFISGPDTITILPGQMGHYELRVRPFRRGHYKGVLSFVTADNPDREIDSDGDEMEELADSEDSTLKGYRLWYAVDILVEPAPPEKILDISCPCLEQLALEVGVHNPTGADIDFEVQLIGHGLSGSPTFHVPGHSRALYEVTFAPAVVGLYCGSLIMYHASVGEFWYQLNLVAERPSLVTLTPMDCELGRWSRQVITLSNPTEEHLLLYPTISNPNNFMIECSDERPVVLKAQSFLTIPVVFMPSRLGSAEQSSLISFHCAQLGEWVFSVIGCGHQPQLQDPISISAATGSSATVIIPFRNPTDVHVRVDIRLTDRNKRWCRPDEEVCEEAPFCLLLKQPSAIPLGPKCTVQIPISYAPFAMCKTETDCEIVAQREDGADWDQGLCQTPICSYSSSDHHIPRLPDIRWIFPLRGFAEIAPPPKCPPALFECKARQRIEERLEVILTGSASSSAGPKRILWCRAVTPDVPPEADPEHLDGVVVGETIAVTEEFGYDIAYGSEETRKDVETAIAVQLVRKLRDPQTGLVQLVFSVIYAPYKIMKHTVELVVEGVHGGKWKFPLRFISTEPEPDDIIHIEAAGLNKESMVAFRLSSQEDVPVPFTASFVAGSDLEFSVHPQMGELPAASESNPGTLITVAFQPTMYGKNYNAKLLIQSPNMNWTYAIMGVLPGYVPPKGQSFQPIAPPHPDTRIRGEKINYLQQNMKLLTTAVSSPIKGAPIIKQNYC